MIIQKHYSDKDGGDFFKRKVILYGNYEDVIKHLKWESEYGATNLI